MKENDLGFHLDNHSGDKVAYIAPDPNFISAITAITRGFPWARLETFFESRSLIKATAVDQVFLMRILALQEILCLDDESILLWVKHQMYLFAFMSPGYKPKLPSIALLREFRGQLDEANILEPFRVRCQKLIVRYSETAPDASRVEMAPSVPSSAEWRIKVKDNDLLASTDENALNLRMDDKWVICPECHSPKLNRYMPPHWDSCKVEPWARCRHCGHKFKV